jgi:hypothetical protein
MATTSSQVQSPTITDIYGERNVEKKRAVKVRQGTTAILRMPFLGADGKPRDLSDFGFELDGTTSSSSSSSEAAEPGPYIKTRFREAAFRVRTIKEIDGEALSAAECANNIQASIPTDVMDCAGVFLAEFGIFNADDELCATNECYVLVEHSAWGDIDGPIGPPTEDDIRLSMRDNSALDNELLGNKDFDLAEICFALARTVQFWNDQPPPVFTARYSTLNFPFREIWLEGVQLWLFQIAEEHYRRNKFPHSAGNLTTDDKNRNREYNAAWKERYETFRRLVMHRKAQLNAGNSFTTLRSGYDLFSSSAIGGSTRRG